MICTRICPNAGTNARTNAGAARPTFIGRIGARLGAMLEIARQRRQLASLSDWQLKDIGLSRADVAREVEKPFWHV